MIRGGMGAAGGAGGVGGAGGAPGGVGGGGGSAGEGGEAAKERAQRGAYCTRIVIPDFVYGVAHLTWNQMPCHATEWLFPFYKRQFFVTISVIYYFLFIYPKFICAMNPARSHTVA